MSSAANTLVLSMKDALREMRYSVRRDVGLLDRTLDRFGRCGGRSAWPFPPNPETQALRVADALFDGVDRAVTLALRPLRPPGSFAALKSIAILTGRDWTALPNGFADTHYRLTHQILRALGVGNALLSEQAFEAAGDMLKHRHAELVTAVSDHKPIGLSPAECEARVKLCAALAFCLEAAKPIRCLDPPEGTSSPRHLCLAPNLYCAVLVGLASAIMATKAAGLRLDVTMAVEAANTVIDVRFSRMSIAMSARDPVAALTREFMAVVPYLP